MYNVLDANGKPDGLASIGCPLSVNRHEWSEECKLDKVMIDHSLQLTFDLVTKVEACITFSPIPENMGWVAKEQSNAL